MYGCSILHTFWLSEHPSPTLVRIIDVPLYAIKFHCQNEVVFGGLLLLAAFLQHMTICTSGLGPWWSSGEKVETVCDFKALWCWTKTSAVSSLPGYQPCVAHIKFYFTPSPSSDIFHESFAHHLAPTTLPLLNSPDTTVSGPTSVSYLNWWENCFLATWLEDGFKGKELLYYVWKIGTCSFSHWRATTL